GASKPASIRSRVVLPQPDGPSSAKNSPRAMSSDNRSTAVNAPNRFVTASKRTSGGATASIVPLTRTERPLTLAALAVRLNGRKRRGGQLARRQRAAHGVLPAGILPRAVDLSH